MDQKPARPAVWVFYDPVKQEVRAGVDDKQVLNLEFAVALLGMGKSALEQAIRATQAMQLQQQAMQAQQDEVVRRKILSGQ